MEFGALSLLPPLLAIIMALLTRHVLLSLSSGIILGEWIVSDFNAVNTVIALWHRLAGLLNEAWILKTLAFALLVGAVMALLRASGGVAALVDYVIHRQKLIRSARGALLFTYVVGVIIFIESSITALIAGAIGRPLCDRYGISRAKLAYVCDSTSAPICSLIALNGWGALLLGLIAAQVGMEGALSTLLHALAYNFYAMAALVVTFIVIWFGLDTPAMKQAVVVSERVDDNDQKGALSFLLIPIVVMIASVFGSLYITGDGDLLKGSGSSAIFHSMVVTLAVMALLYRGSMSVSTYGREAWQGIKSMQTVTLVLLLAFMIGNVTQDLHTGTYIASLSKHVMQPSLVAAAIFVISAIMAFATGTSWGTFSIMIPIAMPMAFALDVDAALLAGAAISGGVFGDHCSPISDTTIISSLSAGCDHIEHVKTQLPYALVSAVIALGLFLVFGFLRA